ncbi:hypothetical protein [Fusobacterium varium]|uniref:hypothetical protein n=1 Tax=Fusobacterium varium TaxID=856 RepID=UPI000E3FD78B|nr:hypothetical protein [Fusobacterium varium]RGJ31565.1 hypothetical protein DXD66_01605 [Fusobacterium varium]
MKRLFKILVILSIAISFISCGRKVTPEEAEEKIAQHMYERYGEEFEVGYAMIDGYTKGDRDITWYEARVTPIRYIGTPKYIDKYYKAVGTVMVKKKMFREEFGITRDTYSNVMLKESANEFYGKKLKELFGENYLSVLEVTGSYSDKSKNFEGSVKLTKEKGDRLYISGGIYIFGRVENDEDREWYRKQIYEFIQFMKETGTFEYVAIAVNVLDDRILSKQFQENEELKQELVTIGKKLDKNDHELFRKKRRELIKKLPLKLEQEVKMEEINKTEIRNSVKWSYYNNLLSLPLYSEKYIKVNSLQDIRRISKFEKIEDVQFTYEDY